tara:strand:- start:275 stop:478 length:204 start_codon:yes stop_codon:yes gene_type:complete
MDDERIPCYSRYDYYKYYNRFKPRYELYYHIKKEKKEKEEPNTYPYDYWKQKLYIESNMKEYLENKK